MRTYATEYSHTIAHGAVTNSAFDPLTASDQELNDANLPPRPSADAHQHALLAWQKAVTTKSDRIIPHLQESGIKHTPHKLSSQSVDHTAMTSTNWSGYALQKPTTPFLTIAGDWTITNVKPPTLTSTCPGGGYAISSTWIGIDGITSPDVFQAGVDNAVYCSNFINQTQTQVWYEWYPNPATVITNISASPGDSVFVQIWATSTTVGHMYFINYTTNKSISITFNAPAGTTLKGDSAEWIVEVPEVSTTPTSKTFVPATLPNFGQQFMTDAYAALKDPTNGNIVPTTGMTIGATGNSTLTSINLVDSTHTKVLNSVSSLGISSMLFQETIQ